MKVILLFLLLFITSCNYLTIKMLDSSYEKCPYGIDNAFFEEVVSDSYDLKTIKLGMSYESMYNNKIRDEIIFLLDVIKKKEVKRIDYNSLRIEIVKKINNDINSMSVLSKYISKVKKTHYANQDIDSFIDGYVISDIKNAADIITKHFDNIIEGNLPNNFSISGERVYFCNKDKSVIRIGSRNINALSYALLSTISYIYKKPIKDIKELKMNGEKYTKSTSIAKLINLPKNFAIDEAYNEFRRSTYFYQDSNNYSGSLLLIHPGYIGFDNIISDDDKKERPYQYSPWYVNAFKMNQDMDQDVLLWSHKFYTKDSYIPSFFFDRIATYEDLVSKFKPITIKNLKKDIRPGQIVLIKDFPSSSDSEQRLLDGYEGILVLIMDYDQKNQTILGLTEYSSQNTDKVGLGYDVISIDSSMLTKRKLFLFEPFDLKETKESIIMPKNDDNILLESKLNPIMERSVKNEIKEKTEDEKISEIEAQSKRDEIKRSQIGNNLLIQKK